MKKRFYEAILSIAAALLLLGCNAYADGLSDYEPQRVIVTPIGFAVSGVNVSWVNPANTLSDVKIYKVNGATESLIQNDNITNASNTIATYQDNTVAKGSYATYRICFEFADGETRNIYTSGAAGITPKLVFGADPGIETDYAWYVNSFRIRYIEGHKLVTDHITTAGNELDKTGAMRIISNDAADPNKHIQFDLYGGLGSNADASKNKAPGTYRMTVVSKGSYGALDLFVLRQAGEATRVVNTPLVNGPEWTVNTTAEFTIPSGISDINRITMRVKNITPGEMLIDSMKLEKKSESGVWTTITMQEFDYINETLTSDINPPENVEIKYSTAQQAEVKWSTAGEPGFNTGREGDVYYGIYTLIFEEIDGRLYLRAKLPDRGTQENTISFNNFVSGNYVVVSQRLYANGEHDMEGTGRCSAEIRLTLPGYICDDIELRDSQNQLCGQLNAGLYTASVKIRNLKLEMKGQLMVGLFKGDKMYRIYKTDSAEIPKTPFGQTCSTIAIENVEIPDVDLTDYKLHIVLWNDAFGDMKSLCDSKVITK